jgi:hypothetical protein
MIDLEKMKELAFLSLKNKHNPFPEAGIVGEVHCFDDEELEFFVHLIAKECVDVISNTSVEYVETDSMHRICDNVKAHFGVKQ